MILIFNGICVCVCVGVCEECLCVMLICDGICVLFSVMYFKVIVQQT